MTEEQKRHGDEHGLELIEAVLNEVEHGYLALTTADGWPSSVPLNFVYLDGLLYVHGAKTGEKMDAIARDSRVGFTVVDVSSLIPSYFRHEHLACPATVYFRSVMLRGRARVVEQPEEKARALQAMMEKLQPEGGHQEITAEDELYVKALALTAVVAIEIEHMSGKFKLGQNLTENVRGAVVAGLQERGTALDHRTIAQIMAWSDEPMHVELSGRSGHTRPS